MVRRRRPPGFAPSRLLRRRHRVARWPGELVFRFCAARHSGKSAICLFEESCSFRCLGGTFKKKRVDALCTAFDGSRVCARRRAINARVPVPPDSLGKELTRSDGDGIRQAVALRVLRPAPEQRVGTENGADVREVAQVVRVAVLQEKRMSMILAPTPLCGWTRA